MTTAPTLRPYQVDSLQAIEAARVGGLNRLLVKKPTGTGKTVTFAAMPTHLAGWLETFPADQRKMLVIAHREELLTQAAEKIQAANPELFVSIEQGPSRASVFADVVIASIQTLQWGKFRRLRQLLEHHTFRLVIVDEAHHAAAPTYRTALVHLGFLPAADASDEENIEAPAHDDVLEMAKALATWDEVAPKDRLLVGMTATPNRSDAIGLGCVFQSLVYSYALRDAIRDGYLVPITPWVVETHDSLDDVRVHRGDFNQRDLADTVNNARRNQLAVQALQRYAPHESTLAFTVDVEHAHALAKAFTDAGITAAALSGETPKDERRALLAAYTAGELQVITNCMVLTEGTDLPRTGCILHAKPTKSATLYEQMTGRGLRIHPHKAECIVIDLVDIARKHSLQAAPVLYGLPPGVKPQGKQLDAVADALEELLAKHPSLDCSGLATLEELELRAQKIDPWAIPDLGALGQGLHMKWLKTDEDTFRLQYPWQDGTEVLHVQRDLLDHYDIVCTLRVANPAGGTQQVRQRTVAAQIGDARTALVMAEQFVINERRSVNVLVNKQASWRSAPASPGQLAALARMRVPHNPRTLTKGAASDLMDLAIARRQQGRR